MDRKKLLSELKSHGIAETELKWVESYLADRQQYTVYRKAASPTTKLMYGVPQGSISGAFFFELS